MSSGTDARVVSVLSLEPRGLSSELKDWFIWSGGFSFEFRDCSIDCRD